MPLQHTQHRNPNDSAEIRRFAPISLASAAVAYVDAMRAYQDEKTAKALEAASRKLENAAVSYAQSARER